MAANVSQLTMPLSLRQKMHDSVMDALMLRDTATEAVSKVYDAIGVDMEVSAQLISESSNVLKAVDSRISKLP